MPSGYSRLPKSDFLGNFLRISRLTRARAEAIIRCQDLRSEFAHNNSNGKEKRERVQHQKKRESEFTTGNPARVKGPFWQG